ncbi:MAG: sugar phosphate isomerase/epimerase [Tannerella sp.]|jgi:sugar phosphate isomerase/epimerase|nr:sugar phosphate isomerase/epimerase [Tannerella sp.]
MKSIIKTCFILLVACAATACNQPVFDPPFAVCGKLSNYPVIAAAGYNYVEVPVSDFLAPGKNDSTFQANLEQMKQLDAKIISCINFIPAHLSITGAETRHDEILQWAETAFRRAQMAGIQRIVFGSGGARKVPDGFDKQEATQQFTGLCRKMAPLAQKYGVTVVIEPLNRGETNIINSLAEGAEIVKAVHHPNIQLLCDIYHMLRENEPADEILRYGDIIRHCHIAEKETRSAPGTAGDNFKPYFDALKKIDYRGCISVETGGWDDFEKQVVTALQYMKQQIE